MWMLDRPTDSKDRGKWAYNIHQRTLLMWRVCVRSTYHVDRLRIVLRVVNDIAQRAAPKFAQGCGMKTTSATRMTSPGPVRVCYDTHTCKYARTVQPRASHFWADRAPEEIGWKEHVFITVDDHLNPWRDGVNGRDALLFIYLNWYYCLCEVTYSLTIFH